MSDTEKFLREFSFVVFTVMLCARPGKNWVPPPVKPDWTLEGSIFAPRKKNHELHTFLEYDHFDEVRMEVMGMDGWMDGRMVAMEMMLVLVVVVEITMTMLVFECIWRNPFNSSNVCLICSVLKRTGS